MTPDDTFAALHRAADAACGARLFTVTVLDRKAGLARRAYSWQGRVTKKVVPSPSWLRKPTVPPR